MSSIATVGRPKSKNILPIAVSVVTAVVGSLALAAQDRYTLQIPNGLAWSDFRGYETWQDVAVSQTETSLKVIAANDVMINAYRDGVPGDGKLFPDGSKITKIEWSFKKNAASPYFVNVPDTLKTVAFIEKDTKRFPDTHGWAYAQWDYDPAADTFKPSELSPSAPNVGSRATRRCRRRITFGPHIQKDERRGFDECHQPADHRRLRQWSGHAERIQSQNEGGVPMTEMRKETDSLGVVEVPGDKLWGAQTQRSLEHFSIGKDLIPREMITAYATLKKAAAIANHDSKRLDDQRYKLIVQTCDEILAGQHHDMFPLHVWMTGSGTQFNMNVNEVISNRCSQIAGTPLGSHKPVHPNDHVNMAQSSNDSFPSAMNIAAAVNVKERLIPAVKALHDAIAKKSKEWSDIVKIGRTHMQDATPLTLGQEWSGYAGMLSDDLERIETALNGVYRLALGGTAVGTGINSAPGFAEAAAAQIGKLTGLPFVTAPNKFTVQGAHDALVQLSGTMRTLAVSLYKIANDIRLMSCGPRAGFHELDIPENEPGSSIMPGKVNPTQCESLAMIAVQVMADDVAVGFGGAGGYLEMNVYKPLMIFNITHSITIMTDGCVNFRKFLVEGTKPNLKKINEYVDRSLMLVTALSPVIGYDKASKIAHYAMDNDLTLKAAALKLGYVTEAEFDRVVDPKKMVKPYVAAAA